MKSFIIALFAFLLLPLSPVFTSAACSGIRITFTWQEPSTSADGTPLADLAKTSLYYQVNAGAIKKKDYKATKLTGGGSKRVHITMPLTCKTQANSIKAWATATDLTGHEALPSNVNVTSVPIVPSQ